MLFALFLVVLTISLLAVWFGEQSQEGVYSLFGLFLLFTLGITVILPGGLQIPNGTNVTISTDNTTGTITELHVPITTDFNDTLSHSMGVWMSLVALFGFVIKLGEIRAGFKQNE